MVTFRAVVLSAAIIVLAWQASHAAEPEYSPQALHQDLDAMMDFIEKTHPDPNHSTDRAALHRAVEELRAGSIVP